MTFINSKNGLKQEAGFTLVEVMIAMIILSIALVGSALVIPYGFRAVKGGGRDTQMSAVAKTKLEFFRRQNYAQLETLVTNTNNLGYITDSETVGIGEKQYTTTWKVDIRDPKDIPVAEGGLGGSVAANVNPNGYRMARITVTVSWKGDQNHQRNITIDDIVTE